MEDQFYINKYLKYKSKYLELKQQRGGRGLTLKSGVYLYLTNVETLKPLALRKGGIGPTVGVLNDKLSSSYRIRKGDTKLERVKKFDDRFAATLKKTGKILGTVGNTALQLASNIALETLAPGSTLGSYGYTSGSTDESKSNNGDLDTPYNFDGNLQNILEYINILNTVTLYKNKFDAALILQVNQFGNNIVTGLYKVVDNRLIEVN
jgi:hypothetical protein